VGARVTLVQDGEVVDAVMTDAEGAYRIADIGSGEYGISVAAAGFVPAAGFVEVPDEKDLRHDAVLASASPTAARYDGYDDADDGMMTGQRHS
jgi:Carboxypeptidase regulatory-like domain